MRSQHKSVKFLHRPGKKNHQVSAQDPEETDSNNFAAVKYFNELAAMINQPVNDIVYDQDEEVPQDLFDEIISMIPPDELPPPNINPDLTEEEIYAEVDQLSHELQALSQRSLSTTIPALPLPAMALDVIEPQHVEKCLEISSNLDRQRELDIQRINAHLQHIHQLVRQLPGWSPAKNTYLKLLKNTQSSHDEKLQQLINAAQRYLLRLEKSKQAFFMKNFTEKSLKVHRAISSIDIHADPQAANSGESPPLPVKRS